MDKSETNGALRMIELQGLALEASLSEVFTSGKLSPEAEELLARLRVELINWNQKFSGVRAWNRY